jgi:hypothetical protein
VPVTENLEIWFLLLLANLERPEIAFFFQSKIPGPDPVTPETVKER